MGFAELTVDEFVLPTFDVAFEKSEKVFLPGDIIEVKGKVNSYSGHSLTSAAMTKDSKTESLNASVAAAIIMATINN